MLVGYDLMDANKIVQEFTISTDFVTLLCLYVCLIVIILNLDYYL